VRLLARTLDEVTEGGRPLTTGDGVLGAHMADDVAIIEVGSGDYAFATRGLTLGRR
jgi:hypothetical protein